ncbi:MAG: hypothetical protein IAC32_00270 [Bacteroidetes bacterium]|uniref:Uncharacterized protein n=1 Tax=Candidatus Enterocola intestinipullorum TaxID=2840783 RepID=A0A9D9EGL8_9BACT|nr:hypothetical protein [Candidatus Enterocola intestinipullorum]
MQAETRRNGGLTIKLPYSIADCGGLVAEIGSVMQLLSVPSGILFITKHLIPNNKATLSIYMAAGGLIYSKIELKKKTIIKNRVL